MQYWRLRCYVSSFNTFSPVVQEKHEGPYWSCDIHVDKIYKKSFPICMKAAYETGLVVFKGQVV